MHIQINIVCRLSWSLHILSILLVFYTDTLALAVMSSMHRSFTFTQIFFRYNIINNIMTILPINFIRISMEDLIIEMISNFILYICIIVLVVHGCIHIFVELLRVIMDYYIFIFVLSFWYFYYFVIYFYYFLSSVFWASLLLFYDTNFFNGMWINIGVQDWHWFILFFQCFSLWLWIFDLKLHINIFIFLTKLFSLLIFDIFVLILWQIQLYVCIYLMGFYVGF